MSLIEPFLPYILAGGAFLVALIGAFVKGRSSGKAAEKAKLDKAEQKARHISDEIDDAVAGRTPASNREELSRWQKR